MVEVPNWPELDAAFVPDGVDLLVCRVGGEVLYRMALQHCQGVCTRAYVPGRMCTNIRHTPCPFSLQDEVALLETPSDDTTLRILYKNGGAVDAIELENLCDKVGWPRRPIAKVEAALKNSFLVASLRMQRVDANGRVVQERLIGR